MTGSSAEYVPDIKPVAADVDRPLWSVMIPTYNCASYLRHSLDSVLRQAPGPALMQIEVVDDRSTRDDPEVVVQDVGRGRIQFYRQPTNVGAIANFNTCIQRAAGRIIHILHGDDLVKDGFYQSLGQPLARDDQIGAAFCRQIYIDDNGSQLLTTRLELPDPGIYEKALDVLAVSNRIPPPSIVVKREVYEKLGGYEPRLFHAADWEMWVRIAVHFPIWYHPEPLALYRVHTESDTSRLFQTGANMKNRREAIRIIRKYLPRDRAKRLTRKALAYSALYGLRMAFRALRTGNMRGFQSQFREALICTAQILHV